MGKQLVPILRIWTKKRPPPPNTQPDFDGEYYERPLDHPRLEGHELTLWRLMRDHQWRTLSEIQEITGIDYDGTISKCLRYLRYANRGAYSLDLRKKRNAAGQIISHGLYQYRVGEPGMHKPKSHPAVERARQAQERARQLEIALRFLDPHHPLLQESNGKIHLVRVGETNGN